MRMQAMAVPDHPADVHCPLPATLPLLIGVIHADRGRPLTYGFWPSPEARQPPKPQETQQSPRHIGIFVLLRDGTRLGNRACLSCWTP